VKGAGVLGGMERMSPPGRDRFLTRYSVKRSLIGGLDGRDYAYLPTDVDHRTTGLRRTLGGIMVRETI